MPPERDPAHLWDMLQAARGIVASVRDLTLDRYAADENLRLAVERRIEIIGEAARRVSEELKRAHPEIPWQRIVGQRNVLIHEYDEIDDERIWNLAIRDIPHLIAALEPLLPPPPPRA
jgi:uncharacterized protein with HEPN domain